MNSKKSRRLAGVLQRLHAEHTCVRVTRRIRGADLLEGYVVAVGRKWVLLATPDDTYLDGWDAVRLRDIRKVRDASGQRLVRRAFKLQQSWPPAPPPFPINLDNTRALIDSLAAGADLVAVHLEYLDPRIAFFGRVRGQYSRRLWLHEIDGDGRWTDPFPFRRDKISRLGTGDRYSAMLLQVAGPAPKKPQAQHGGTGDL